MIRIVDLQEKEVINIRDGVRLGFISDVEINIKTGAIISIVIIECNKILGLFGTDEEYVIPWCDIKKIGDDLILVDIDLKKSKHKV